MTTHARGNARLAALLADPDRTHRVSKIRDQMREHDHACAMNPDSLPMRPADPQQSTDF